MLFFLTALAFRSNDQLPRPYLVGAALAVTLAAGIILLLLA